MDGKGNSSEGTENLERVQHLLSDLHDDILGKVERLRMLEDVYAAELTADHLMVPGGEPALEVLREARWSFVHGSFVSTVLLCQVLVEQLLTAAIYMGGEDLSKRVSFSHVLERGRVLGYVSDKDVSDIRQLIDLRNPLTHFRPPLDSTSYSVRALGQGESPTDLMQRDSISAIRLAVRMLGRLSL